MNNKHTIQHGWIFDEDGVLFDTHDPILKRSGIADFIFNRLKIGEPIAINSGRGVAFTLDSLMPSLVEKGISDEMLSRLSVVGEKGALVTHFRKGKMLTDVDNALSVPQDLRKAVYALVD